MAADASMMLQTVKDTLSGDNQIRNAAEREYKKAQESHPAALVSGLFGALQVTQAEQAHREQSAILLRKCLEKPRDAGSAWQRLEHAGQHELQVGLLRVLEAEQDPKVRRKVADLVQNLCCDLVDLQGDSRPNNLEAWPELMPCLMRSVCDVNKDAGARADCIWIMSEISIKAWKVLVANAEQTGQVVAACLQDSSAEVRGASAVLFCTMIDNIESKVERRPFAPLVPQAVEALKCLAQQQQSPGPLIKVLKCVQSTTELADFFKDQLPPFIAAVIEIAKGHQDEEAKKMALEAALSFLEAKPKVVAKIPQYFESVLEVCISFMTVMEDDIQEWANDDPEAGDFDEDFHSFGKEAIDRVCRIAQMMGKFEPVLESLKPVIARLFQGGQWKQVCAAMATMRQIAEFIEDEATVEQMLGGIVAQFSAENPRVRHQAWSAVTQFSSDHSDTVSSEAWVERLLPEFVKALDDPCDRVALRSMETFQYYGETVDREDLEQYVPQMMEKLGTRLQASPAFQRKAITYISVIASVVDEAMAPYYAALMPLLKGVIEGAIHKDEERTLLGRCFECISVLAKVVGREVFKADARVIMEAMIKAAAVPGLPKNDPVKEYVLNAAQRISGTLKEDFVPFVGHVLPMVFEKFNVKPRELTEDNSGFAQGETELDLCFTKEGGEVKVLAMYTSEMQDLRTALECVNGFVEVLGKHYAPFVSQTAQPLLPMFEFPMAEDIRDLTYEVWGQLVGCARQGGQNEVVAELVMEFLKRILPKFEEDEVDVVALKTRADGVTACLKQAGSGVLSPEQVLHLCKLVLQAVGSSLKRRAETEQDKVAQATARKCSPDDEEDEEDGDDDEDEENSARVSLMEVIGALMEHHPDLFMAQGFDTYLELVRKLSQARACTDDRKLVLFILCDMIEYLGARWSAKWPDVVPILLQEALADDPEIRQPANYGLSVAAKMACFAPLTQPATQVLVQVVADGRKSAKKNKHNKLLQASADNALSAIAQLLLNHAATLGEAQGKLWAVWLGGMPCIMDDEEGVRNNAILVNLLQQERPEVVGEGGANVPRLFGILVDAYKTDFASEEVSRDIRQLANRFGEARLEQLAASFSARQKKKLLRLAADLRKGDA